jgi:hypothetical protein
MNRLAPLITRPPEPVRAWAGRAPSPPRAAAAPAGPAALGWTEDLKLFATAWLGGLVFFGTLIA